MSIEDKDDVQKPEFCFDSTGYRADLDRREFRSSDDPEDWMVFDSEWGRQFCKRVGILTCPRCNASMIAGRKDRLRGVKCVRCGRSI